jgi:hypothetical protein
MPHALCLTPYTFTEEAPDAPCFTDRPGSRGSLVRFSGREFLSNPVKSQEESGSSQRRDPGYIRLQI